MEAGVDPGHQARQVRLHAGEQFRVRPRTGGVPIRQPKIAGILVPMNFAFHQHQKIGLDLNPPARQRLHQAGHVAPGVYDPFGAASLQVADNFL